MCHHMWSLGRADLSLTWKAIEPYSMSVLDINRTSKLVKIHCSKTPFYFHNSPLRLYDLSALYWSLSEHPFHTPMLTQYCSQTLELLHFLHRLSSLSQLAPSPCRVSQSRSLLPVFANLHPTALKIYMTEIQII